MDAKEQISSIHLDSELLDKLVKEHLATKDNQIWSSSEEVRRLAYDGQINAARQLTSKISSSVLEDQRLLFKLKRQQFVEYLRKRTADDHALAIDFLRRELAPLALDAYPEAYGELKRCLLTLVFAEDNTENPVSPEWDIQSRSKLAAQLGRTVREAQGGHDTQLAMLLRYLAIMYNAMMLIPKDERQSLLDTSVTPLVEMLDIQFEGRPPPPTAPEAYLVSPRMQSALRAVPNTHIMMMKDAFHLTREEVMDGLRRAGGDLEAAFRNELSALPISRKAVDWLAEEYAAARGFEDGSVPQAMDTEADELLAARRESGRGASPSHETSEPKAQGVSRCGGWPRDGSRSPPKKVARQGPSPSNHASAELQTGSGQAAWKGNSEAAKCLHELRCTVEQGDLVKAVADIQSLDPAFLEKHPALEFELHAARFQQLLDAGDTRAALQLARSKLAVISDKHTHLQPQLKVALCRLVPGMTAPKQISLTSLADVVEGELRSWLGLAEPQLVHLLKALLAAHSAWFELQQCEDRFADVLSIKKLQAGPQLMLSATGERSAAAPASIPESGADTVAYEQMPMQFDEELISEAMIITDLGRTAVLAMLRDVGGDLMALVDQYFH